MGRIVLYAVLGVGGLDPLLDQRLGGGALLAVAESVGLPVIAAVFLEWVRSDERDARASDLLEDETSRAATAQPHHETSSSSDPLPSARERPATPMG